MSLSPFYYTMQYLKACGSIVYEKLENYHLTFIISKYIREEKKCEMIIYF